MRSAFQIEKAPIPIKTKAITHEPVDLVEYARNTPKPAAIVAKTYTAALAITLSTKDNAKATKALEKTAKSSMATKTASDSMGSA